MERNEKGKTIFEYLNDPVFWKTSVRPFDDPYRRTGTPPRVKTPYGSVISFTTKDLTKPIYKYSKESVSPGNLFRFSYDSSFGDEREHDEYPYIILLEKDSTGRIFNKSKTSRPEKYPSVYNKLYFYGLNLNYFKFDLASLFIEMINIQRVLRNKVSYGVLNQLVPELPKHAFRMYYVDWCKGFRAVDPMRVKNG